MLSLKLFVNQKLFKNFKNNLRKPKQEQQNNILHWCYIVDKEEKRQDGEKTHPRTETARQWHAKSNRQRNRMVGPRRV